MAELLSKYTPKNTNRDIHLHNTLNIPGPCKMIQFASFVGNTLCHFFMNNTTMCHNYSKHGNQLQWHAPKDISQIKCNNMKKQTL